MGQRSGQDRSHDPDAVTSDDPGRDVARPRGAAWRSLRAEGIEWEGQVLLVGGEVDLAARLIITKRRLALVRGGAIVLETPREWLRPTPQLVAENGVQLTVTPPDAPPDGGDTLLLRARDGRGAAAQIVAAASGRELPWRLADDEAEADADAGEDAEPRWHERVAAAPSVALPPLAASLSDDRVAGNAAVGLPGSGGGRDVSYRGRRPESISDWTARYLDGADGPTRSAGTAASALPVDEGALTTDDDYEVPEAFGQDDEENDERSAPSRALLWSLRAAILLILVGTALYFSRDRLPFEVSLAEFDEWRDSWRDGDWDDRIARLPGGQGADDPPPTEVTATVPAFAQQPAETSESTDTDNAATETTTTTEEAVTDTGAVTDTETATESLPPTEPPDPPIDETTTDEAVTASTDVLAAPEPTDTPVPTETSRPTEPPTQTETPWPTETPTPRPTETPVPTETPTPTQTPQPTATATLPPTAGATATSEVSQPPSTIAASSPTVAPTATSTPTELATATAVPTNPPTATATAEPTGPPTATPSPTTVPSPSPTPTLEPLPPSFDAEATPSQALAAGAFRYTVEAAVRGPEITDLPELADVPGGEWVVVAMYGQNWSQDDAVFDMAAFSLIVDGQEIQVDSGNDWVAELLGYTPAYGSDASVLFAPEEGHRFVLTFLIPEGATDVALRAGDQTFALDRAVETSPDLAEIGPTPDAPRLQRATVVEVINGEQITVEIDGQRQDVRYLGIDIPFGDDCYAAESTAANRTLVEGKTVYLERQSTNVDARGNWVRDVWLSRDAEAGGEDGADLTLAAAELVKQGAAVAAISSPNTRFAAWLTAAEQTARDGEAGLWGECGGLGTGATGPRRTAAPHGIAISVRRWGAPI